MGKHNTFNKILESIKQASVTVAESTQQEGETNLSDLKFPSSKPERYIAPEEANLVNIDLNTITASTKKLLAVNKGLVEPDERDSIRYRRLHPVNDLMRERIRLDADKVMQNAMRRVARRRSLKPLSIGFMDPYTEKLLVGHALSMPLEEINPMHLVEQARRITQMGPGGLPDDRSISPESQALHPHEFGFISVIAGPECVTDDTQILTKEGWLPAPEVTTDHEVACNINGKLEFHKPNKTYNRYYKGEMIGFKSKYLDFLVTPNHRLWVRNPKSNSDTEYNFDFAENLYGQQCNVVTTHDPWQTEGDEFFTEVEGITITMKDWCSILGYWLSKDNPEIQLIHENHNDKPYLDVFKNNQTKLSQHLNQYVRSGNKTVPEYVITQSVEVREAFVQALLGTGSNENLQHTRLETTSLEFARDIELILISLGYPTILQGVSDSKESGQNTKWVVTTHIQDHQQLHSNTGWYKKDFEGHVYCLSVPGELMYIKRNNSYGHWTGNSSRIGVDTRAAWGTKLGSDGKLYQRFYDRRNKRHVWLSPTDLENKKIGLPQ